MSKQPGSLLAKLLLLSAPLWLIACSGSSAPGLATLDALTLSAGSLNPAFDSAVTGYSAIVPAGTLSVTLTPTATSAGASITVAQDGAAVAAVASGTPSAPLTVPARGQQSLISIAVTNPGETAQTYTVQLVQADSADASLAGLSLSAGTLSPAFASGTTAYTAGVPAGTATIKITPTATYPNVKSITVQQDSGSAATVTSGSPSASLTVPAPGAQSKVTITVTAQNGYSTQAYVLTLVQVAQSSSDSSLANLTVSAGSLHPAFASGVTAYTVTLPSSTSSLTITPTEDDPSARSITLSQDGGAAALVVSGAPSAPLNVPPPGSSTAVSIVVTAQSGTTTTYQLTISRAAANDATLAGLTTTAGALTPAFAAGTTSYAVAAPFAATTITVTPSVSSPSATATLAVNGGAPAAVASGAASAPISVPASGATTTIAITVTAADGTTTQTYSIALTRAGRTDSALSALTDSTGALTGFSATTLAYSYSVPFQSGAHTITATTHDSLATLKVNGAAARSGAAVAVPLTVGSNTVDVAVTSADGTATTTYVLTITEAAAPAGLPGLVNARTVTVTPAALRTVAAGATLPANAATNVPIDTLLRIGFDAAPTIGASGSIKIFTSGGALVDSIALTDQPALYNGSTKLLTNTSSSMVNVIGGLTSGIDQVRIVNYTPIQISGNTAVIIPHNNKLIYGASYYVTIDSGVLAGTINGAAFAGITATSGAGSWTFSTKAAAPTTYNVADDDSGDFATVQGAIDQAPSSNSAALTISIAPGVYPEMLFIRKKNNLTLQGTNNGVGTIIQVDNCDGFNPGTGGGYTLTSPGAGATIPTTGVAGGGRPILVFSSTTGTVLSGVTFLNSHPQGSAVIQTIPPQTITATTSPTFTAYTSSITQAETIYFNTTFSFSAGAGSAGTLIAKHSNFISYQDTIQVKGYSWFYDCFITGDTDFIWGNANVALFERSEIKSRNNPNGSAIVQSRAYLTGGGTSTTPASYNASDLGFVFLDCALTKEAGTFNSYLARSPGAVTTSGSSPSILYLQYDIVSYIGCSMDTQVPPAGWDVVNGNPTGANVQPSPVTGWREYGSVMPDGVTPIDVSQRVGASASPYGSIQLTSANVSTFFPSRAAILEGAQTDGTYTSQGLAGFAPTP